MANHDNIQVAEEKIIPIESLDLEVSNYTFALLEVRLERLVFRLLQLIRKAYEEENTVNTAGGAASSLTYEIQKTTDFIGAVIGPGKANSYLKYLEFGVKGIKSSPAGTTEFARTATRPGKKFARNILEWIKLGAIDIPEDFAQGKKDPLTSYAYAVAQSIINKGTPARHIIERVLTEQTALIEQSLAGA